MTVLGSFPDGGGLRLKPRRVFEAVSDSFARAHRVLFTTGPGAIFRRGRRDQMSLGLDLADLRSDVERAAAVRLAADAFHFVPGALVSGLFEPEGEAALKALVDQIAVGRFALNAPALQSEALVRTRPELYTAGLAAPILRVAAAYIGMDCLYLGATLKREVADGRPHGNRQWHLDIEDERFLRVLLYLSPVTAEAGPFQYLPAALSAEARDALGYRIGYLSDETLCAVAPREWWRSALGEAGDAIVFDGTRLFHRAQPPVGRDRYSITFTYVSSDPLELQFSTRLSAASHRRLIAGLPAGLHRHIPPPASFW